MPDKYVVVSLSGGKDSTAMLLMMLERGEQIDDVVVCDTGMEFPEMYKHLDKLEADTGITFTRLKSTHSFEWHMFERVRGQLKDIKGYGWARPRARWCTTVLKTSLINNYVKDQANGRKVVQCIGIAADEPKRIREHRYPLVEYGITEEQALKYCYERGYTWGGLYEHFGRVSCWCCPLQSLRELRALRKYHPDLWQKLREMDQKSWNDFRIDYTVEQLEERFSQEDKQLKLF